MDEIREIETELRRLRDEADHQKTRAATISKENRTLAGRNEYLTNKLKEASYVYGEAGKRLLYFINNQVNPIVERLNALEAAEKKLNGRDKVLGDSMLSTEKAVKNDVAKTEKMITSLNRGLEATELKLQRAIKLSSRKGEKGDAALDAKVSALIADLEGKMQSLRAAVDKSSTAKAAALSSSLGAKMELIKERSLIMGKDIEELYKFEKDIEGLEGKLQAAISHITQIRLDMEKLSQSIRNDMAATKTTIANDIQSLSAEAEKRLLSLSSELSKTDEKIMGDMKLEFQKSQKALSDQLDKVRADMAAFESSADVRMRKAEATLKRIQADFSADVEKRMKMLEAGIQGNAETSRDIQKMCDTKFAEIVKRAHIDHDNLTLAETKILEELEVFKDMTKRKEMTLANRLEKLSKSVDGKLERASAGLEKHADAIVGKVNTDLLTSIGSVQKGMSLMGKDIQALRSLGTEMSGLADELSKRKEETAALSAKLDSMSHAIADKSEKDDMRIKEHMSSVENDIKTRLETAESRIVRENVRSFAAARQTLKKDIHALREENAALKAEVRNLRGMIPVVNGMQKSISAIDHKAEESRATVEKISSTISSDIEKEALKVSKELAGISAKLKADLRDVLAREKERFAGQSADISAKYDVIARTAGGLSGQVTSNSDAVVLNKKRISSVDAKVDRILNEIVGLKKQYKVEMGKLLKELEG